MGRMTAFVAHRTVQMVLSLWAAITLVFVAVTQLPGDPVRALFGFKPPPPAIYHAIRNQFHLDEPLFRPILALRLRHRHGRLGERFSGEPVRRPGRRPLVTRPPVHGRRDVCRWEGQDVDLTRPLPSDLVLVAGTVDDRIARPRGPYLGMLDLPSCLNAVQRWYGRCTRPVASGARCGPSRDELVDIVGAASTR
jgi:hypothetical protein